MLFALSSLHLSYQMCVFICPSISPLDHIDDERVFLELFRRIFRHFKKKGPQRGWNLFFIPNYPYWCFQLLIIDPQPSSCFQSHHLFASIATFLAPKHHITNTMTLLTVCCVCPVLFLFLFLAPSVPASVCHTPAVRCGCHSCTTLPFLASGNRPRCKILRRCSISHFNFTLLLPRLAMGI